MWYQLGNIPITKNRKIRQNFLLWPKGTAREKIWHWFNKRHSRGVHWLMYENPNRNKQAIMLPIKTRSKKPAEKKVLSNKTKNNNI